MAVIFDLKKRAFVGVIGKAQPNVASERIVGVLHHLDNCNHVIGHEIRAKCFEDARMHSERYAIERTFLGLLCHLDHSMFYVCAAREPAAGSQAGMVPPSERWRLGPRFCRGLQNGLFGVFENCTPK